MIRTRRSCYLSCILESDTEEEDKDDKGLKILAEPGNSLLFVYQSKWQGRLLQKYGNELSFLDATCVCVFMSIHLEGFICLGLEFQGTDQRCCVEDVIFLCQVPSLILQYESPSPSN